MQSAKAQEMSAPTTTEGFRLSHQQRHRWRLQQQGDGQAAFMVVRLRGEVSSDAVRAAVQTLVERHQSLRTSLLRLPGMKTPVQVIEPTPAIHFVERSLDCEAPGDTAKLLDAIFGREREATLSSFSPQWQLVRSDGDSYLAFTAPGVTVDTVSLVNLFCELPAAYATAAGDDAELPDPTQYVQFSEWQHSIQDDEDAQVGREYWQDVFEHVRSSERVFREKDTTQPIADSVDFSIEPGVAEQLLSRSDEFDVEPSCFLYACWQLTLWRLGLCNADSMISSQIVPGRTIGAIDDAIGVFETLLPVILHCQPELSFERVLSQVDAQLDEGLEWLDFLDWSRSELVSEDARAAALEVGYAYHEQPETRKAGGVSFSLAAWDSTTEPFAIMLSMTRDGNQFRGSIRANGTGFSADEMPRIMRSYQTLLAGVCENTDAPIGALDIVSDADRQRLLVDLNRTQRPFPDQCIHELFEEVVDQFATQTAIAGTESITYGQLESEANQVANYLISRGVEPACNVAICGERSPAMLIGILGILKAGAAYVPLSPTHPKQRLEDQLRDVGAETILTASEYRSIFASDDARCLVLDEVDRPWKSMSNARPARRGTPEDAAYITYTSGSTGAPKGVVVSHRNLANYACFLCTELLPLKTESPLHFGVVSTLTADLGNTCIYAALLSGGCLHLLDEGTATNGKQFAEYLAQHPIDVLKIVPSHFRALLRTCPTNGQVFPQRFLILGGEALSSSLFQELQDRRPPCEIINHYGPTETTVGCLTARLEQNKTHLEGGSMPIGGPISNTQAYVLDSRLEPVPVGVTGELYIAGAGVTQGYLNQPELTKERFVPCPFSTESNDLMYRTGDLVRYLPDGQIEFVGRADRQVKIRGFRIELGEIEAAICRHDSVEQAFVVRRGDEDDQQLVAYFVERAGVPEQTADLVEETLKAFVAEQLPRHMIPAALVRVPEFPLTANGKIDSSKLPDPRGDRQKSSGLPRTPTEEMLSGIWSDLLSVERFGMQDNFFALGGHSLVAMQLVARVRDAFDVDLPLERIFASATVEALATEIDGLRAGSAASLLPPLVVVPRDGNLPLSHAQRRLWFLDQLSPGDAAYNVPVAVRMKGDLDIAVLQRVLQGIVERHETLRTTFAEVDGVPTQRIATSIEPQLVTLDLRDHPAPEDEAHRLAILEAEEPFALAVGPLFRAKLFILADNDQVLLFSMHHIISDLWSRMILVREFVALYNALSRDQPSPLTSLDFQYADFASWQQRALQGDVLQQQVQYWQEQLTDSPALLELPTDRPRPTSLSGRGAEVSASLPQELCEALKTVCNHEGTTLFMTLLAGFEVLLHFYSGQNDLCVGTPVSGRKSAESERMIGFFLNHLVIRNNLGGNPKLRDVLRGVRAAALAAYNHQDVPFEQVVDAVQPERSSNRSPLFQASFTTVRAPSQAADLAGLQISAFPIETSMAKFDLALSMVESPTALTAHLQFSTDLFDHASMTRMLDHYQQILQAFASDLKQSLSNVSIVGAAQGDDSARSVQDVDVCLHELFEQQVVATPDAVAVVAANGSLTYRALDDCANRLANRLRDEGIKPEDRVVVVLERSLESTTAILGVLKAGAVYVPVSPGTPDDRLRFILDDISPKLTIVNPSDSDRIGNAGSPTLEVPLNGWGGSSAPHGAPRTLLADSLAYIIYTSGSTGRPKGVAVPHRAIANHCREMAEQYGLTPGDVSLQFADLTFDPSIEQAFAAFAKGACLVIREDEEWDLSDFASSLTQYQITHLNIPPAYWQQLATQWQGKSPELSSPLKLLIVGGDVMQPATLAVWCETPLQRVPLLNAYGPTEAVVTSTLHEVRNDSPAHGRLPIGKTLGNRNGHIVDSYGRLVPDGLPGELIIGGQALARGYWNRPALTAERFVPDSFSTTPVRAYRTGDYVRRLADGEIDYLRRVDQQQVKVRGFRIEIGEIESVLADHSGVAHAAVVGQRDVSGELGLAAFVVGSSELSEAELRDYLGSQLPPYMIPTTIRFLDALPLNASGKVNRNALPRIVPKRRDEDAFVAPRNETESSLAKLAAEVLAVDRVGVNDSFFELGGHSLLATQFVSRIRRDLQVELPLRILFEKPTIALLAEAVKKQREQRLDRPQARIGRVDRASYLAKRPQ